LLYRATEGNFNYLGNASLTLMARQILSSQGPSGKNKDYVYALGKSLRDMGVEDQHVFQIEELVNKMEQEPNLCETPNL